MSDRVCRFCSTPKPHETLKQVSHDQWDLLRIILEDQDLPNEICNGCASMVDCCDQFRRKVKRSIDEWKNRAPMQQRKIHPKVEIGCEFCSRKFADRNTYQKHLESWHEMCIYCKERIPDLEEHYRTEHTTERPFPCNQCSRTFEKRSGLTMHKKRCGQKNATQPDLNTPVRGASTGSAVQPGPMSEISQSPEQSTSPMNLIDGSVAPDLNTPVRGVSTGSAVQPVSMSEIDPISEQSTSPMNLIDDSVTSSNVAEDNVQKDTRLCEEQPLAQKRTRSIRNQKNTIESSDGSNISGHGGAKKPKKSSPDRTHIFIVDDKEEVHRVRVKKVNNDKSHYKFNGTPCATIMTNDPSAVCTCTQRQTTETG